MLDGVKVILVLVVAGVVRGAGQVEGDLQKADVYKRQGYDMDVLPSDLATYGRDAKALLKELQSQNERMFLVTFLVLNTGKTEQELETNVFQAVSIAQKHNCELCRLDFQQEQGLMSVSYTHLDVYKRQEIEKVRPEMGHPSHTYGRYQNVFLTDEELADLQVSFPAVWEPVSYTHLRLWHLRYSAGILQGKASACG